MDHERLLRTYLIGAVIVWVGILFASAIILKGTDQFAQMLPILGGGAVWFVLLVPQLLRRREPDQRD